MDAKQCRCGHSRTAHEHYRPGSECSLCAPDECGRFRPNRSLTSSFSVILNRLRPQRHVNGAPGAVLRIRSDDHPTDGPDAGGDPSVAREA